MGERVRDVADDPARPAGQHEDPVGEEDRLGDGVGHEHDARAGLAPDGLELDVEPLAGQGVERAERLVEEQDRRLEGEARAIAARWRIPPESWCGRSSSTSRRPTRPERLPGARLASLARPAGELERERDVVERSSATAAGAAPGRRSRPAGRAR